MVGAAYWRQITRVELNKVFVTASLLLMNVDASDVRLLPKRKYGKHDEGAQSECNG
jgi:hypothetical protein